MESLQKLKSRLQAVKNIGQITKAMELVAATKMRRSQEIALNSRPYAFKALDLLKKLSLFSPLETELLAKSRPIKTTLVVIVASDRGLAGSFNTQIFRWADIFFEKDLFRRHQEHRYLITTVGKKAEAYALKRDLEIVKKFYGFGDFIHPEDIAPLSEFIIEGFKSNKWDRVIVIFMNFQTALKQEPLNQQILPVDFKKIEETIEAIVPAYGKYAEFREKNKPLPEEKKNIEYIFEPSPVEVLNLLTEHLIKMQIYHLILEANASEHSARRVAMKNASDNAENLSQDLIREYNKVRQATITTEIMEMTSTQIALTQK